MIVIYFFSTKSQQFFAYVWAIFPVIAFFLVSFYTLDFLFSPSYLIMVPVFTIMFKINYKKRLFVCSAAQNEYQAICDQFFSIYS